MTMCNDILPTSINLFIGASHVGRRDQLPEPVIHRAALDSHTRGKLGSPSFYLQKLI